MAELGLLALPPFPQAKQLISILKGEPANNVLYFVTWQPGSSISWSFYCPTLSMSTLYSSIYKVMVYVTSLAMKYHLIVTSLAQLFLFSIFCNFNFSFFEGRGLVLFTFLHCPPHLVLCCWRSSSYLAFLANENERGTPSSFIGAALRLDIERHERDFFNSHSQQVTTRRTTKGSSLMV